MPLSVKSAERRTGYQIIPLYGPGDGDLIQTGWVARDDSGQEVLAYRHKDPQFALERLCDGVYRIHCNMVGAAQSYRCADCGRCRPLDPHHKIKRSKGRVDTCENLVMVCRICHDRREGIKVIAS